MQILTERVYSCTTTTEREISRNIIKKLFNIDSDYGTELKPTAETDKEKTFELSDVNNTTVGAERLRCAEVLFQPSLTGKEASGLHDISSRTKCVVDIRKELYASVVFQGTGEAHDGADGVGSIHDERLTVVATSSLPFRTFPVARKCCSSLISPVHQPADSTTLLFERSVSLISAGNCTPMSCRQVARPCFKRLLNA